MAYRGVVIEPAIYYHVKNGGIKELQEWGVNLVRLHIVDGYFDIRTGVSAALRILEEARESPIKFVVSITHPERTWNECLALKFWRDYLPAFEAYESVIGYDVYNEPRCLPREKWEDRESWRILPYIDKLPRLHMDMRELTDRTLIFQSGPGGNCEGFQHLEPLGDDNVWYAANLWHVRTFTRQGANEDLFPDQPTYWPDKRNPQHGFWGIVWDMRHAVKWSERHPDQVMYVPEFGCAGCAPIEDANRWAHEAIALIEDRGWHATAHSYPARSTPKTKPHDVFHMPLDRYKEWWALNGRPSAAPTPNTPTKPT